MRKIQIPIRDETIRSLKVGDPVAVSGVMMTGRDAGTTPARLPPRCECGHQSACARPFYPKDVAPPLVGGAYPLPLQGVSLQATAVDQRGTTGRSR